jgi:multimeric flavodoxin WrbA
MEETMKSGAQLLAMGIAGSPRKRGNSTTLLRAFLEGTKEAGFRTRVIHLNDLTYRGCQACDRCVRGLDCKLNDDLNSVFPYMLEAKIWAMASPIYYDNFSGQLKTFFDRLRFTTHDPYKLEGPRRGIVIVSYEDDKRDEYRETARTLAKYFNWNNRGDFGRVKVVAESNLGPRDAWKNRPELLEKLKKTGFDQAQELKSLL